MARVTILLGKGGTGRTTVARALARNGARRGPTTLLHAEPTAGAPEGRVPDLRVRVLDPITILEDAMARLVPLGPLTRSLMQHPAYRSLVEVAPGIKEAAALNFLYGFLKRRPDHVIIDGPATGHGVHFLEAPGKLQRVLAGKLADRLRKVDELLHDPDETEIVLVALAEELPAVEVCELSESLARERFPVRGLVVNKMPPPVPFEVGPPAAGSRAPRVGLSAPEALWLLAQQRREAEEWLVSLRATGLPLRIVPFFPGRGGLANEVAPFLEGFP